MNGSDSRENIAVVGKRPSWRAEVAIGEGSTVFVKVCVREQSR